jgi:hypothetical protein
MVPVAIDWNAYYNETGFANSCGEAGSRFGSWPRRFVGSLCGHRVFALLILRRGQAE